MECAISVKSLKWSYRKKEVLRDIEFSVPQGEVVVVMGLNGCGKTTLLNCIMGFLKIRKQTVYIYGRDISVLSANEKAKLVSYVSQNLDANCMLSVYEYLTLGLIAHKKFYEISDVKDEKYVMEYAEQMNICSLLDKKMNEISGGERQLVAITRALVQNTPIIIFDEPMAALDYKNQIKYLKMLKELQKMGKTIVFSSHNPNHAMALSAKVCLIHNKRILTVGDVETVLTNKNMKYVYGDEVSVINNQGKQYCVFDIKNKNCTRKVDKGRME